MFHLETVPSPENGSRIIEDLVLLNQAGIRIILVHGPGSSSIQSDFDGIRQSIAAENWELQTRIHSISYKVQTFSAHLIRAVPSEILPEQPQLPQGRVSGIMLDSLHEALKSRQKTNPIERIIVMGASLELFSARTAKIPQRR